MFFEIITTSGEYVYINLKQVTSVEPVDRAISLADGSKFILKVESYDELIKNLGIV